MPSIKESCGCEQAIEYIATVIGQSGIEFAVTTAQKAVYQLQEDSEDEFLSGAVHYLNDFICRHTDSFYDQIDWDKAPKELV